LFFTFAFTPKLQSPKDGEQQPAHEA